MCAFDATIAAPEAILLDIAVLQSTRPGGSVMEGLLSDALLAYNHLLNIMIAPRRPGELRSMVVNNSWGMFHSSWDYPVGNPGNYSHNQLHPFNRIVAALAVAGADIFFAAGNCGRECPDGRCQGVTTGSLVGANSSPHVTTVAGVDVSKARVGYSTSGPGALMRYKPDIAAYTHFAGSGVYAADGGTSAACPVAAGVVAAFRSRYHYNPTDSRTRPGTIKNLINLTAEDRGFVGFDFDYGWGIIDGRRLAAVAALSALDWFDFSAVPAAEVTAYHAEVAAREHPAAIGEDVKPSTTEEAKKAKA
jgi:subtilisin family serine protease